MKKNVILSNRAVGPAPAISYKALMRRKNKATGNSEAVSMIDLIDESQRGETIQFTINNTSQETKTFAVFPGRLNSVAAIKRYTSASEVDYLVHEGEIRDLSDAQNPVVIGSVTSKTLDLAQEWVKDHPVRFCKITLNADNESQFQHEFGLTFFGLTRPKGQTTVLPRNYVSADQFSRTQCEIPVNMQLDDATVLWFTVGAGRSLDVTLQMVAEINLASTMETIDEKVAD